jgi:hypothetical protein
LSKKVHATVVKGAKMCTYHETGKVEIYSQVTLDTVYTEATYKRIAEDALYFLDQSKKDNISGAEQNRYARMTILLMAFYLESLSNFLFDALVGSATQLKDIDHRSDLPTPIRRFRAAYFQLYKEDLSLSIDSVDCIRDIFTIRNKIIAHPTAFSSERHSEHAPGYWDRSRQDMSISYLKFKDFPFTYTQFTSQHAQVVLKAAGDFLIEFHRLLKGKVSDERLLNACLPLELMEWEKKDNI